MMAATADPAEGGIVGDTYEIFINVNAAPLRKNPRLKKTIFVKPIT